MEPKHIPSAVRNRYYCLSCLSWHHLDSKAPEAMHLFSTTYSQSRVFTFLDYWIPVLKKIGPARIEKNGKYFFYFLILIIVLFCLINPFSSSSSSEEYDSYYRCILLKCLCIMDLAETRQEHSPALLSYDMDRTENEASRNSS